MDVLAVAMAKAYTDSQRIGYCEDGALLFETEFHNAKSVENTSLVLGKTYNVRLNGELYRLKCESIYYQEKTFIYVGNPFFFAHEEILNNGLGFFIVNQGENLTIMAEGDCHAKVHEAEIHTIDPELLPGVVLPVVELETTITANEQVPLSEADSAKLNAVADNLVFVVGFKFEGEAPTKVVVSGFGIGNFYMLSAQFNLEGKCEFLLACDGGSWTASVAFAE